MKRRTPEQGLDLVRKFKAGGLSQTAFARQVGIGVAALRYWLGRAKGSAGFAAPVKFVELTTGGSREGPAVSIEMGSMAVRLERLPTADYLAELIRGIVRA